MLGFGFLFRGIAEPGNRIMSCGLHGGRELSHPGWTFRLGIQGHQFTALVLNTQAAIHVLPHLNLAASIASPMPVGRYLQDLSAE